MAQINKVDALIKIAEAFINEETSRVRQMGRIFDREIAREVKDFTYETAFEISRDEKKFFIR